jgi:hypothetical protein
MLLKQKSHTGIPLPQEQVATNRQLSPIRISVLSIVAAWVHQKSQENLLGLYGVQATSNFSREVAASKTL